MALGGMHDQHPEVPRRVEHGCERFHRARQLRNVVAERLTEAARLHEIALHVDAEKCGVRPVEIDRFWLRSHGTAARLSCVPYAFHSPRESTLRRVRSIARA